MAGPVAKPAPAIRDERDSGPFCPARQRGRGSPLYEPAIHF